MKLKWDVQPSRVAHSRNAKPKGVPGPRKRALAVPAVEMTACARPNASTRQDEVAVAALVAAKAAGLRGTSRLRPTQRHSRQGA